MSKKKKLLDRLLKTPKPRDFPWDDLVTLMAQAGFDVACDGGSHHLFEHRDTRFRFSMSKTHPRGVLKLYQVKDAIDALTAVGVISEDM